MNSQDIGEKPQGKSKKWQLVLGVAISAAMLALALYRVDFHELAKAFSEFNYLTLAICLPLFWLPYLLRAFRWKYLLQPLKSTGLSNRLESTVLGFAGNIVFPARLGELIRAIDFGRREDMPSASVLGTIVVERAVDTMGLLWLFATAMGLLLFSGWSWADLDWRVLSAVGTFGLLSLAGLAVLVALMLWPQKVMAIIERLLSPFAGKAANWLISTISSLLDGLVFLRNPGLWWPVALHTALLWFVGSVPFYVLAIGVGHPVPLGGALLVGVVCSLSAAIPSAPGYVGTMHWAIQFGYSAFLGVPAGKALAVAIVLHGGVSLFTLAYACLILGHKHIPILQLGRKARQNQTG